MALRIDDANPVQGNRAMAAVLLLYYHLLREGGITNDQTVYVDADHFNGFDYLDVEVARELGGDIDQGLLREGAVVFLLCELDDMISDHEDAYLSMPLVQRILAAESLGRMSAVPEAEALVRLVNHGEEMLDHRRYREALDVIYEKYVISRMRELLQLGER